MPVAYRKLVRAKFPYARIDFEIIYISGTIFGEQWFVYDTQSAFLLSLGCTSAWFAWKVAYDNLEKVLATINKVPSSPVVLH